ncbi:MAG: KH domain-containing protein [candidate division NC10 bacterium]|nr:KH domain-containing protein [candidate division NC10 bacterium]
MKDLVEFLAKSLVDHPEEVSVSEVERDETTLVKLRVAQSDLGRVIGREGRTAKAIRVLLSASAARVGKKAVLEIVE